MARKLKAVPSIPYCKQDSARGQGRHFPRKSSRGETIHAGPAAAQLLGEDGDHLVALWGNHPLPCVLLAVDLVFHEEVSFLLEVGAAVAAHVALGVTLLVPDLHKHASGEGTGTLSTGHTPTLSPPQPPHTGLTPSGSDRRPSSQIHPASARAGADRSVMPSRGALLWKPYPSLNFPNLPKFHRANPTACGGMNHCGDSEGGPPAFRGLDEMRGAAWPLCGEQNPCGSTTTGFQNKPRNNCQQQQWGHC